MSAATVIHVPFRCPDCGDTLQFETLKDLRSHLETEHMDLYTHAWKKQQQFTPALFGSGCSTPVLEMYHADAVQIKEDLLTHKRNELNNKQRRMRSGSSDRNRVNPQVLSRSTIRRVERSVNAHPSSFRQYGHSSRMECKYSNKSRVNHEHSNPTRGERFLDESFRDDDSLADVTKPMSAGRHINKIQNVSSSETAVRKSVNSNPRNRGLPDYVTNDMDSHVKETLTALSQEVVLSRANQHATSDSLMASQEVFTSLEHSAQERICKQQEIIATLALKLSEKDEKLADLAVQVSSMKNQTADDEVKNFMRLKSNQESEKILHDDLLIKQKELMTLTQKVESARNALLKGEKEKKEKLDELNHNLQGQMEYDTGYDKTEIPERESSHDRRLGSKHNNNTTNNTFSKAVDADNESSDEITSPKAVSFPVNQARLVERDMLAKEKELVSLRSKSMQLESDRQTLLLEMQALLEIAANDNEKLRAELANQGKQLSKLNLELERSKQEQSELLGETNTLYQQADVSLSRLKHVLEERDTQLSSVSAQLDQAKEMQGLLTREREEYLKVAVEKEASYQVLVQENAVQLKNMRDSLQQSQVEKEKLQEKLKDFKDELNRKEREDGQMEERMKEMESQLNDHEEWQDDMKQQIKNKEERLQKAKRSMEQMNSFMSDTANRELEARSRLEQFISNLIDRSTQTEAELKNLREAYAAKEEAFKNLAEARAKTPPAPSKLQTCLDLSPADTVELLRHPYPTWQEETREELKRLSSSPPHRSTERHHGSPDRHAVEDWHGHSPTRNEPSYQPNFIMDAEDESEEPMRLRSSIRQVKNDVMETIPERQLKNRPLLINGREFPHPSAYTSKKSKVKHARPDVHGRPGNDPRMTNLGDRGRNGVRPDSDAIYYRDNDEYPMKSSTLPNRAVRPRVNQQIHLASSPPKPYNPVHRNNNQQPLNNSPMFTNTPEVERMYQNVQKHSLYATNPANQFSKRNSLNRESGIHPGVARPDQLPMDEYGIIWGPYDKSVPRTKPLKKRTKRRSVHKSNRRDGAAGHKDPYADGHQSDCYADSDEDGPASQRRSGQDKSPSRSKPFLQQPAPLGDKIALLLTSIAPGNTTSSARRDYYADNDRNRPNNEQEERSAYSASESEHSSPIVSARAVRERVDKITSSRDKNRHDDPSHGRSPRSAMDDCTNSKDLNSSLSREVGERMNAESHPSGQVTNDRFGNDVTRQASSEDRSPSDTVVTVIENKMDSDRESGEDYPNGRINGKPHKAGKGQSDKMLKAESYNPVKATPHLSDKVDGRFQSSSFLHPDTNYDEQFESHNAESDTEFSSSSYAPLRPESNTVDNAADDTQEEEDVFAPNQRLILAQVHSELKSRGSMEKDKANEENKRPSLSELREKLNNKNSERESLTRSDSTRSSLQRQDSHKRSFGYDSVMKELIEKHPYINRSSQEIESKNAIAEEATPDNGHSDKSYRDKEPSYLTVDSEMPVGGYISAEAQEIESSSPPTETIDLSVEKRDRNSIDRMDTQDEELLVNQVSDLVKGNESTDDGLLSSDDEGAVDGSRGGLDNTPSRMRKMDTIDASTDTDLEKLATPGQLQKPLGTRKKKKVGAGMKKDKNRKQKSALRLKDMAGKGSWTSVDANDPEEMEREERMIRRRHRVALFCALAYTDTKSLLAASQVCNDWRKIAHHPALWKNVKLESAKMDSQFLVTLSQWCTQIQSLTLKELTGRDQKLMESEEDYSRAIRGSLEPGLERLLFSCQSSLKSLTIERCENIITDKCLWVVSSNCRMLSHLSYRSGQDPVHPQVMWALGGGCPGITSLYVHPYHDSEAKNAFNNRCLLQIGQFYRDLHEVGLGGMEFNMAGLLPFIQACQHLQTIHMDSCIALTDDLATAMCRAGLKDLHTFTLTHTAFQAKAIQTLHANCRQMKRIHAKVTPKSCGLDLLKKKEKEEYKKLVKGYKDLKKKAGLSHILTLDIQEVE